MRPLSLKMTNFLSHRDTELDFRGMSLAMLSGGNGNGKSSVIDAMRFALWGHARGGLDGVITEGEQACRVEFMFMLGSEQYLVSRQRSRKGNGTTLLSFQYIGSSADNLGEPDIMVLDGKSVGETQEKIIGVLRMTDELFTQTTCANQGNAAAFTTARPAERKAVLGEILDLELWERRATIAREWTRDLGARIERDTATVKDLEAQAMMAEPLEADITLAATAAESTGAEIATTEGGLAQAREARASLVRDRNEEADRRADLSDLVARHGQAETDRKATGTRLDVLRKSVADKDAVAGALARAQEAAHDAAALEAVRQEHERVGHEIELAEQRWKTATSDHHNETGALRAKVEKATAKHEGDLYALEIQVGGLRQAVATMEDVPCQALSGDCSDSSECGPIETALRGGEQKCLACQFLERARAAQQELPTAEKRLAEVRAATPWADDERELAELDKQHPGSEHATIVAELKERLAGLSYHRQAHTLLTERAGSVERSRRALADIERAEAQLAEVQTRFDEQAAAEKELADRMAALEAELGEAKDWPALIAATDRAIAAAEASLRDLRARADELALRRGALEEKLRAAREAGERAEQLAVDLRAGERRLSVLKALATAFGRAGIPALLIEKAVPDLEAVANDVLSTLSDGRMTVELRSQRETKAKTITETLDIIIADELGARPYEAFSGGEAMMVDLALRVALAMLMASHAGARCELFACDETFAPLDAHRRALSVDCLRRIADRFGLVLAVSHDSTLTDQFPTVIEVTKDETGSHVEVMAA